LKTLSEVAIKKLSANINLYTSHFSRPYRRA
jgi:hypothetical protein